MDIAKFAKTLSDEELLNEISQLESGMNHLRKNCVLALCEKNFDPDCIRDYLDSYEFEYEKWEVLRAEHFARMYKKSIVQLQEGEESKSVENSISGKMIQSEEEE